MSGFKNNIVSCLVSGHKINKHKISTTWNMLKDSSEEDPGGLPFGLKLWEIEN